MSDDECTCTFAPPRHDYAYARSVGNYRIYLDVFEDNTTIDPECPYHGDDGTMVVEIGLTSRRK